jgi:antitoxin component HigA of HigAB toxin-antitoxin module
MAEEQEKQCDPEDIICQADRLAKMRNLRSAFDDKEFREKYPSLVELSERLDESIKEEEEDLGRRLGACDLPMDILEKKPEEKEEESHEP